MRGCAYVRKGCLVVPTMNKYAHAIILYKQHHLYKSSIIFDRGTLRVHIKQIKDIHYIVHATDKKVCSIERQRID